MGELSADGEYRKGEHFLNIRPDPHARGRIRTLAVQLLVVAGFLMPAVGFAAVRFQEASAATTFCVRSTPDGGNFGTVSYTSYIDAYTDPGCTGNRYVGYDYYSTASATIYIDMGELRLWLCGAPWVGPNPGGYNTTSVNAWSGWTIPNTCGFQADVSTYFSRSGYGSDWTYTKH